MGVIDLHTHVFNLRYVPVAGVLGRFVPASVARGLSDILKAMADVQAAWPAGATAQRPAEAALRAGDEMGFLRELASEVPLAVVTRPAVLRALADVSLRNLAHGAVLARSSPARLPPDPLEFVRLAAFEPEMSSIGLLGLFSEVPTDLLKWLYLMTRPEAEIARRLHATYPEVELFVHHMMDMDLHYKDTSQYPFPPAAGAGSQVRRMLALQAAAPAPLRVFTAWDPFRADCREIVEQSIALGCRGVKFYPSSGYRPSGNRDRPHELDTTVPGAPTGEEIDARNDWLYDYCASSGVPLFAHCAEGDLQAHAASDRFADPAGWIPVLERHPGLHLALGHAGGGREWARDWSEHERFLGSWAGTVARLCGEGRFRHVYCDFGMFSDVLNPIGRQRIGRRLASLLAATPRLGESIAYGSDWSMLYRRASNDTYLSCFQEMFDDPALRPWRDAFFADNARRYLGL